MECVGRDLEARCLEVGHELRAHARDGPEVIAARDVVLGDKEADARPGAGVIRHNPGHDLGVRDTTSTKVAACLADPAPAQGSTAIRTNNRGRIRLGEGRGLVIAEVVPADQQGRGDATIEHRRVRTDDLEGNRATR